MVWKDLGRHHLPIMSKNGAHRPALRPEFEHVPPLAELFESGVLRVQLINCRISRLVCLVETISWVEEVATTGAKKATDHRFLINGWGSALEKS